MVTKQLINRLTNKALTLDRRDRKLLHKVRVAAEYALERANEGHNDGWQKLQDALDKATDEMGEPEEFDV